PNKIKNIAEPEGTLSPSLSTQARGRSYRADAGFRYGQIKADFQPAGFAIGRCNPTATGLHAGSNDGEAQTHSARLPRPRVVHAIKGIEQLGKAFRRDAGTAVGDGKNHPIMIRPRRNGDGSGSSRISDRVAQHVAQGPSQQLRFGQGSQALGNLHFDLHRFSWFTSRETTD